MQSNYFTQRSKRLIFRKLTKEDFTIWRTFFDNNDRLEDLGIDTSKDFDTLTEEWINAQLNRYDREGLGHLAAIDSSTGLFIGMGGILPREIEGQQKFEIAYSLLPKYWGMGYATEIANSMLHYGIQNSISKNFISIIHVNNLPSMRVAEKIGFSPLQKTTYLDMNVIIYGNNTSENK